MEGVRHSQAVLEDGDPSLSELNQNVLRAWREHRPRDLKGRYPELVDVLGDPHLSEMIWIMYGEGALSTIVFPLKALNDDRSWWKFWVEKNTIASLARTRDGKARVWQMLHDAGAWF